LAFDGQIRNGRALLKSQIRAVFACIIIVQDFCLQVERLGREYEVDAFRIEPLHDLHVDPSGVLQIIPVFGWVIPENDDDTERVRIEFVEDVLQRILGRQRNSQTGHAGTSDDRSKGKADLLQTFDHNDHGSSDAEDPEAEPHEVLIDALTLFQSLGFENQFGVSVFPSNIISTSANPPARVNRILSGRLSVRVPELANASF